MPYHSQLALFRHTTEHLERTDTELAEDNCAECQFLLANQILRGSSDGHDDINVNEENAHAVYWLIKASKQGHVEATEMLKQCLSTGRGINKHNIVDVKACVTSSITEQKTVKLAKDIFITLSDGEDFITSHQLQNALNLAEQISAGMSAKTYQRFIQDILSEINNTNQSQNWRARLTEDCEKIDENMMTLAAKAYSRGQLPLLGRILLFVELCFLFPYTYLSLHLFTHPVTSFGSFTRLIFETFSLRKLLRSSSLYYLYPRLTCLLLVLHYYLSMKTEFHSFPFLTTALHWLSLFMMVASTCEILYRKQEFRQFRAWSNLFVLYSEGDFIPNEAEIRYSRNVLSSYVWFFISLLVYLATYINGNLKTCCSSGCAALSLLFTLFTFYSFSLSGTSYCRYGFSIDVMSVLSFMMHVVLKYPFDTDKALESHWAHFLYDVLGTWNIYIFNVDFEVLDNIRIVMYCVTVILLFCMARRYKWNGTYTDLMPHCLVLSWWQLTLLFSRDASWYVFVRVMLIMASAVLFLPLTILLIILFPIYSAIEYIKFYENNVAVVLSCIVVIISPLLSLRYNRSRYRSWKLTTLFQVVISCGVGIIMLFHNHSEVFAFRDTNYNLELNWSQYIDYCSHADTTMLPIYKNPDVNCSHLIGSRVYWTGYVESVRITRISNFLETLLNYLPDGLTKYICCSYGKRYRGYNHVERSSNGKGVVSCHITYWNRYEFKIQVEMMSDSDIYQQRRLYLKADHSFYKFVRYLSAGDSIWYIGTLTADEHGKWLKWSPSITLKSLGCLSCASAKLAHQQSVSNALITRDDVLTYGRLLFNILLSPIIIL